MEGLESRDLMASAVLDSTFSGDGKYVSSIMEGGRAVTQQADGKIVVAGFKKVNGTTNFAVARFHPSGTPDTTFSGDGVTTISFGSPSSIGQAIYVQSDGKIVVAGSYDSKLAVARLTKSGSLDTTFSGDGRVVLDTPGSSTFLYGGAITQQADGKLIVAADENYSGTGRDWVLARLTTSGSKDNTFSSDGYTTVRFSSGNVRDIPLGLRMIGNVIEVSGTTLVSSKYYGAIARLTSNGSYDNSYSGDGRSVSSSPQPSVTNFSSLNARANQNGAKLFLLGYYKRNGNIETRDFGIVRVNSSGSIDGSFGSSGLFRVTSMGTDAAATSAVVQSDNKLLIVGSSDGKLGMARIGVTPTVTSVTVPTSMFVNESSQLSASGYDGTSSNPTSNYTWQIQGPGFNQSYATQTVTFNPTRIGQYTATVTLADNLGVESVRTYTIDVQDPRPQITELTVPTVSYEGRFTPLLVGANDPTTGAAATSFSWLVIGPSFRYRSTAARTGFTPPENGAYQVRLDIYGADSTNHVVRRFNMDVRNVRPKIYKTVIPASAVINRTVRLVGRATDPAGVNDPLRYAWLITGPQGYRRTFTGPVARWKTPFTTGTYRIQLTVSDDDGGIARIVKRIPLSFT